LPSICATAATAGCNGAPDACTSANGTYHIVMPPGRDDPMPAIMFLHGHASEGLGTLSNTGMVDVMLQRGYAVIAPDGQPRKGASGRSWGFHPDRPSRRDETAFLIEVADDAAARFGLDRERILLAGFSIGGSMTSYVACSVPGAFAAYAPVAGSFWRPHPESCAGPVRLFHMHGLADRTVPMAGRQIAPGFMQGDVLEAMEIWRATNTCPDVPPAVRQGIYSVQRWNRCAPGADLELALHAGGHAIPNGWAEMALDWFEDR